MDIQNGHIFATGLSIDVMFSSSVGVSQSANLMVQLSMTLSDPEPKFQGHSIVQRRISRKRCMLYGQIYQVPYASMMGILCLQTTYEYLHSNDTNVASATAELLVF